jgi:hypothetical protein
MGQNPAHPGASPAHPPFTLSCVRPSSRLTSPAGPLLCFLSARPSIAEPRPTRLVFTKPRGGPPKSVLSSPAGSLLHRMKFSPTVFFTRILRILTKRRTNLRLEIDTASANCALRWKTPIGSLCHRLRLEKRGCHRQPSTVHLHCGKWSKWITPIV